MSKEKDTLKYLQNSLVELDEAMKTGWYASNTNGMRWMRGAYNYMKTLIDELEEE